MKCDICREKNARQEVIVEDNLHNLLILSFCSQECRDKSPFPAVSNVFSLDKGDPGEVE